MKYSKDIREQGPYDVVVCGGGPAGCAAALSARREGLSVLLVESTGQLGGMAVNGLVSQWLGGRTQEGEWVVGGLFRSLSEEAESLGCALIPRLDPSRKYHPFGWFNWFIHGVPLDPFRMSLFLDEKMCSAGVQVLFFSRCVDALVSEGRITHAILSGPSGLAAIRAKVFIDATGDAELASAAGCTIVKGREEDGKMAPSSLIFHVYDVDTSELTKAIEENHDPKFRDLIASLREKGIWNYPYDIFICTRLTQEGEYFVNTIRLVGVDGTDPFSLSDGIMRGRKEVYSLLEILRKYFPGFADAKIKAIAPLLGVRETRRIKGDFVLKVEDLQNDAVFDDTIGFSMYGWDLPDPDRPSVQPFVNDEKTGFKPKVKKGLYTPLPFRIMIPDKVTNLLCAGRIVSVEGQVLGPVRVMAPCMAMGEAAGMACLEPASQGRPFYEVDFYQLKKGLKNHGCIVDVEDLPVINPRIDQI